MKYFCDLCHDVMNAMKEASLSNINLFVKVCYRQFQDTPRWRSLKYTPLGYFCVLSETNMRPRMKVLIS